MVRSARLLAVDRALQPQCRRGTCAFRAPVAPVWRLRSRFVDCA